MPDNFKESKKYFPTALQEFQFYDKYSRFDWEKGRRETWVETVDRVIDHIKWLSQNKLDDSEYDELKKGLLEMKATPSMRMLAMAGKAAQRDGTTIFNCSYIPIDSIDAWIEALIISMCGCGVGYSVEKEHVDKLPEIKKQNGEKHSYVVQDSMTGWADALRYGLEKWFNGEDVEFDYSLLRPAGAPLKTKGGHSSGPKVLQETLDFIRDRILNKQDGKLSTLDAHDIMCKVGDASISGGVRRCIKAGTLVNLNRGMVPIEDVKVGDEVLTDDGYKKVLDHVYQGRQGLVEIKTETGAKLYVTPDHRMAVLSDAKGNYEFKQAQNLLGEDRLVFINQAIIGTNQDLKKLDDFREADQVRTDIKQPELTIETAWILGKFLADGYVYITEYDENGKGGNCHVEFACHTKEVKQIERIKKWFESIGIEAKVAEGEGNWVKVRSCNRRIARWFGNYKEPNKTIKVPEEIFKSPTNIRWSFLAGLGDGDGSFTARPFVEVSTIYEDFGRDVVKLFSSLGIVSEIKRHREEIGNWKPLWTVSVKDSRSLDVVRSNFSEFSTKAPIPYRKAKQAGYTIPNKFVRRDLKNIQYKNKYSVSGGRGMNHHTCSEITGADNFTPVKVVSVSYHGEDETYDLTVDGNHVFVAEGYLTHNTAMISLFDGDDQEMLTAKDGDFYLDNPQRFNANNSSVWPDREMTKEEIREFMYKMDESKRGEPGIFSRRNANLLKPDRRKAHSYGTNPCYAPGTLVQTKGGHFPIEELVGKTVEIWDGSRWVEIDNFRITSHDEPILKIKLHDGSEIRATEYHKFILEDNRVKEARFLLPGDRLKVSGAPLSHGNIEVNSAYFKGFLVGDGTHQKDLPVLYLYDTKYECEGRLVESANETQVEALNTGAIENVGFIEDGKRKRMVGISARKNEFFPWTTIFKKRLPSEIYSWNLNSKLEFIAGVMDADGTASDTKNGYLYQISSVNKEWLIDFQSLLKTIGVSSKLSIMKQAGRVDFNDGYGEYDTQTSWRLTISQESSIALSSQVKFSRLVSFSHKKTKYKVNPKFNKVVSVESDGVEKDVYCCTVPESHAFSLTCGVVARQCGEINLRPMQFCNLSIAVARADDTEETLKKKVELATIFGTIQAMESNYPGLRPDWAKNNEEERLLGVDVTGFMDCPLLQEDNGVLSRLRDHAVATNVKYAAKLGINRAAAVTCNKPSGNSSTLFDCSSGIHARYAKYYIRRVRINATSPTRYVMEECGMKLIPDRGKSYDEAEMFVAEFPVKAPEGSKVRDDLSAKDQFMIWLKNKKEWTEHNPSFTLYYKEEELDELIDLIYENQDYIGGISFLPHSDAQYDLMPYEEIDAETYEKMLLEAPTIDWSLLPKYEQTDLTEAAQLLACVGGACDI